MTGEMVGAGGAVVVEKGLVALQRLDACPFVLAGDPRRQTAAGLAGVGAGVPVLAEHGLATDDPDALLQALGSGLGLGLGPRLGA
jgi:hypothetical protein